MSAPEQPKHWIDALADNLRRFDDVALRLEAIEALMIDLTRAVTSLTARIDAQFLADEREAQRLKALEAERIRRGLGL